MRIDVTQELIDFRDDKPFWLERVLRSGEKDEKGVPKTERVDLTFRYVATESLGANLDEDRTQTSTEKLKRGLLMRMLHKRDECELSLEEAVLIKERVAKVFGVAVLVVLSELLDPPNPQEAKDERRDDGKARRGE